MLFLLATIHLAIAVVLYNVAVATTEPRVLNRPMAAVAAAVWPLSLPAVVVVALATRSRGEGVVTPDETLVRVGS